MVTLENIVRKYRHADIETLALDEISLQLEAGEFVSVMGPSGCGKSTLLNIMGLIDEPDSGRLIFNGEDVSGRDEESLVDLRRSSIGFIFQNFNLIDDLSVWENVELPLIYNNVPGGKRKTAVREALELVEMAHRATHRPSQLSGGEQQRIAIARAVVYDPSLILADEPTGNLDSRNSRVVLDMLKILQEQGASILMVTHSLQHAECADRIIHMHDGRIVPHFAKAV